MLREIVYIDPDSRFVFFLPFIAGLFTLFGPLITAVTAATLTATNVQSEEYQLVQLTSLSSATIVRGHVAAALHRMRVLGILLIGLMPAPAIGAAMLFIRVNATFWSISCYVSYCPELDQWAPPVGGLAVIALIAMFWYVGTWGGNLPAAAYGVTSGLTLRKTVPAALRAIFLTLVLIGGTFVIPIFFIFSFFPVGILAGILIWLLDPWLWYLIGRQVIRNAAEMDINKAKKT